MFTIEIWVASFWEAELLQQELTRYERELRSRGPGNWIRLRCEITRVRTKLEAEAELEPIPNPDAQVLPAFHNTEKDDFGAA